MVENNVYKDLQKQLKGEKPNSQTVVVWNTRSSIGLPEEADHLIDYYKNVDIKLKAQLQILDYFDDTLIIPGVWADYGVALEATAFGSEIKFFEDNPPMALPYMQEYKEIKKMKSINPYKDGLMPKALDEYEYMLSKIPKKYLNKIEYLDGCICTTGPLEVASMILGHEKFYRGFYESPQLIKKLLQIVTDGICKWINALSKVSGETKIISMIEHLPGQISRSHFKEFGFPYIKEIFDESNARIKLYHNESKINHITDYIGKLGIDIFHFGEIGDLSIKEYKREIDNSVLLMGNIPPIEILKKGTEEAIRETSLECINEGKERLILSSGGGMVPDTPKNNVEIMIKTAREFKY